MDKFIGAALVVGIDNYLEDKIKNLDNACADAKAIADMLARLRYDTEILTDINRLELIKALDGFYVKAQQYGCAVFYYAGHGVEINGTNYLMTIDANTESVNALGYTSFPLQEIVTKLHEHCETNILIIDACRDNPFAGTRSLASTNLAPVHAPKGTIIAFSTSPGETAKDGGFGNNGVYAGAILQHITTEHQPIEAFFKQVRTTVSAMTSGTQTSWEHTSLIGDFCFNRGQLMFSKDLDYSVNAVQDRYFDYDKSKAGDILRDLHESNWYKQNSAIAKLRSSKVKYDKDDLFVLGRNVLQSAHGDANDSKEFLRNPDVIARFGEPDGENHILNGILFEIYFDSKGDFRGIELKSHSVLNMICKYMTDQRFVKSFEFVEKLLNLRGLFFVPSPNPQKVNVNVLLKEDKQVPTPWSVDGETVYVVQSIKIDANELLVERKPLDPFAIENSCYRLRAHYNKEMLHEDLSEKLHIPLPYLNLILNEEPGDCTIVVPDKFGLKR